MIFQRIKQNVISDIFSTIPMHILEKLTQTDLIIPYYHIVSDREVLHIKYLYNYKNIQQFKEDINILLERFIPIGLFDVLNHLKKGTSIPKKTFLITFDDGFREIYDIVAPILTAKGLSATFFLNSDFIDNKKLFYKHKVSILIDYFQNNKGSSLITDVMQIFHHRKIQCSNIISGLLSLTYTQRYVVDEVAEFIGYDFDEYLLKNKPYLTSHQIKRLLKQDFTIGAHSIDHPNYASISLQEQLFQTLESVRAIRDKFSLNYSVFSFPHDSNNLHNDLVFELLRSGKIDLLFGNCGWLKDKCPLNIQRINFERTLMPADKILAYEFARNIFRSFK